MSSRGWWVGEEVEIRGQGIGDRSGAFGVRVTVGVSGAEDRGCVLGVRGRS